MLCSFMLVSAVQHHKSVIILYISLPSLPSPHPNLLGQESSLIPVSLIITLNASWRHYILSIFLVHTQLRTTTVLIFWLESLPIISSTTNLFSQCLSIPFLKYTFDPSMVQALLTSWVKQDSQLRDCKLFLWRDR